ncbi:hypothetical protein GGS20DRAFT_529076 [Poronia punctata]|nr:hypothetical protein GGS20DRAFT_529076 [Poronia punctata]
MGTVRPRSYVFLRRVMTQPSHLYTTASSSLSVMVLSALVVVVVTRFLDVSPSHLYTTASSSLDAMVLSALALTFKPFWAGIAAPKA